MQDPEWELIRAFVNKVLKDAMELEAEKILESRRKAKEQRKNMYWKSVKEESDV